MKYPNPPNDDEAIDYEDWLEKSGLEDTEENRGWYDCDEDDRYQYIQDHPDWWDNF